LSYRGHMKEFLAAHGNKVKGVLSCFDRMLFRGYLPVTNGAEMAKLVNRQDVGYQTLKDFLLGTAEGIGRIKRVWAQGAG
jgi:hypothetical protein